MKKSTHTFFTFAVVALFTACSGGGDATAPEETTTTGGVTGGVAGGGASSTPTEPTPAAEPTTGYGYVTNPAGGNYGLNCVKDYSTGLIWEGKNPNPAALTYAGREMTNYDSTTSLQKPDRLGSGTAPTAAEINAITNTIGYQSAVNGSALCGFSDWRLPTKDELATLIDLSKPEVVGSPRINTTWFPYTHPLLYWTSNAGSVRPYEAWYVVFYNGVVMEGYRDVANAHVRLVRSAR